VSVALVRTLLPTNCRPGIRMTDQLASTFIEFLANRPSRTGATSRRALVAQCEANVRAAEPHEYQAVVEGSHHGDCHGIEAEGGIALGSTLAGTEFVCVCDTDAVVAPRIVARKISALR
jgi:hypothetical protein